MKHQFCPQGPSQFEPSCLLTLCSSAVSHDTSSQTNVGNILPRHVLHAPCYTFGLIDTALKDVYAETHAESPVCLFQTHSSCQHFLACHCWTLYLAPCPHLACPALPPGWSTHPAWPPKSSPCFACQAPPAYTNIRITTNA